MKELNKDPNQNKLETLTLVVFALLLAILILVSKFVIGINFSLMEQGGYLSIGYHEVHGSRVWALEFESFSGSISSEAVLPEGSSRTLMIHSETDNSPLTLKVRCGREEADYILQGAPLTVQIPGDKDKFTLTLSGSEVFGGYFNAVWE